MLGIAEQCMVKSLSENTRRFAQHARSWNCEEFKKSRPILKNIFELVMVVVFLEKETIEM